MRLWWATTHGPVEYSRKTFRNNPVWDACQLLMEKQCPRVAGPRSVPTFLRGYGKVTSPLWAIVYSSVKGRMRPHDNQGFLSSKQNDSWTLRKLTYYVVRKRGSAVVCKRNCAYHEDYITFWGQVKCCFTERNDDTKTACSYSQVSRIHKQNVTAHLSSSLTIQY